MKFRDIIGQEAIKQRLIKSVKDNRVSHAQLFHGPEGSGKLAMALAYAQYINCRDRSESDSCGKCPSCIKYEKLIHPDLHFVYPIATTKEVDKKPISKLFLAHWRTLVETQNGYLSLNDWYQKIGLENKQGIINTDDCNEILHTLSYKSYESEYKVMIIWMADKIYHAAAPKILKILEEPPDKTLFILITEQSDQLLPTILSRTQMIKFTRLSDAQLVEGLVRMKACEESEAGRVKYLADGNLNAAVKILKNGETNQANFTFFRNWMRLCFKNNYQELLSIASDFQKLGREKQKSLLNYGLKISRYCLLYHHENEYQIKIEGEELKFSKDFSPFIHTHNIEDISQTLETAIYHIERNGAPSIIFLDVSLKMVMLLKVKNTMKV